MANKSISSVSSVSTLGSSDALLAEVGGSLKRIVMKDFVTLNAEDSDAQEILYAYGIEFDTSVSSTTCTRIGNTSLHAMLPIQNKMRGCILDDNGVVVQYLPDSDWTTVVRDGSLGQVMVELPAHYIKFETDGNKRRVMMSLKPLNGYQYVPTMYIGAYQATVQLSTGKLCSVVNKTSDYRGGNNVATNDNDSEKSFLGRPRTNINRAAFRTAARKRNSAATAEWNLYTYEVHRNLYWLYVVEYANLNAQADYNAAKTSAGYKQGGLGNGVTAVNGDKWTSFNGLNPFIPCGTTDAIGNNTGVVSYTITDFGGTSTTVSVPRYRGIENPFGHIWMIMDGIDIMIGGKNGDGDGKSKVYVCTDPAKYTDSDSLSGYTYIADLAREDGYVKTISFGINGDIIPTSIKPNGSSTEYFADYNWTNQPDSGVSHRMFLFGGAASSGARCGLAALTSFAGPGYSSAVFGSRLTFMPKIA